MGKERIGLTKKAVRESISRTQKQGGTKVLFIYIHPDTLRWNQQILAHPNPKTDAHHEPLQFDFYGRRITVVARGDVPENEVYFCTERIPEDTSWANTKER